MGLWIGKLCIILIASIALINTQVRLVRTLFPQKQESTKMLWYTLLMGGGVASLLLLFSYGVQPYLDRFSIVSHGFFAALPHSIRYSGFILLAGSLISLLLVSKKQWRPAFFVSTTTVLTLITGMGERLLAGTGLGAVLLKATGEEVLKTASAQTITAHTTVFKTDVIILSILAGLGFALFENLTYFISSGSLGQFLVRSLTTSLLHGIFTGAIGYMLRKHNTQSYLGYIIAYVFGISLHSIYNTSMIYAPIVGGLVFVIGGYFLLTYFLYKSDRLYIK